MDRRLPFIALFATLFLSLGLLRSPIAAQPYSSPPQLCSAEAPNVKIRLLCIKHSRDFMADGDANLAVNAVKSAAGKGLNVQVVGNEHVDKRLVGYFHVVEGMPSFTEVVNQHITTQASPGDTLVVFTIGHGFPNGSLQNIGQRKDVMKVLAEAAEKHNQRILWWQLSCHACAGLPSIDSLPSGQQNLFSVYASSTASQTSGAYIQGRIMEKVFNAIANDERGIDPNQDGTITAGELRAFLNTTGSGSGSLFFAKSSDYPVFGLMCDPYLPIIDRNGSQRQYERDYILVPLGR